MFYGGIFCQAQSRQKNRDGPARAAKSRDAIKRSRERLSNRPSLQQQLSQAERHLAEGATRIEKQRELMAKLFGHAPELAKAKDVLRSLNETQKLAEEDRQRILREMDLAQGLPRRSEQKPRLE